MCSLDLKRSVETTAGVADLSILSTASSKNCDLLHKMVDFGKFTCHGLPWIIHIAIERVPIPAVLIKK